MISISSCTEQEVVTTSKENVSIELRTTNGPCGDAPGNNSDISLLSTFTAPNGNCCVTIRVNIDIKPGYVLQTAQSYAPNGLYISTPLNQTVTQTNMNPLVNTYTVCFPNQVSSTDYLSLIIIGPDGKVVTCVGIKNPC